MATPALLEPAPESKTTTEKMLELFSKALAGLAIAVYTFRNFLVRISWSGQNFLVRRTWHFEENGAGPVSTCEGFSIHLCRTM
jgi:hypothetical protein